MVVRRPFWKWPCWKSIGPYPYTEVLCCWSLKLIFKAKVKLESGNQKIQYGRQAAILKVTSLKINRLLLMATINMHMKFEIEISKQTWVMLRKPCRLQTDGRTDGQGESSIPPSNFVGRGYYLRAFAFVIFYRACVCVCCTVIFCQLLPVDPWNSVFASINDMQSMVRANNGVYYGLKVVFACLHISLSPTS